MTVPQTTTVTVFLLPRESLGLVLETKQTVHLFLSVIFQRLSPAASVCRSLPGLHGRSLWRQPGGDLRGHEAGASCSSHTQHLQDHRVPPDGHQQ